MFDDISFLRKRGMGFCSGLLMASIFLTAIPGRSQDKKQTQSSDVPDDVIKVTSNLVSVDVLVKDKKGKTVTDLKAEDFTVSENGVPQKIEFFDSTLTSSNEAGRHATATVVSEPKPSTPTGFPRNIIALVLDGQSTELANLKHVREGIVKYIRERISDSDSVALFSVSGNLQLLQPFTQDKTKLLAAVDRAYTSSTVSKTSEARSLAQDINSIRDQVSGAPTEPIAATPGAGAAGSAAAQIMIAQRVLEQYIQLRSALSVQQTRPVLAALAAICEGLRAIPGKKTLVMFSQGFVAPETLDWQVQSTIDIANRANVAIYIIDSTGLTGGTPKSGALVPSSALAGISGATSQESRIRAGAGESVFDITRQEGLNRQQDLLYRISEDTGGRFVKNTNDIAGGLQRIDAEIRSRYTLAYHSTDSNFDGSFRKVKIEVQRPDTSIVARPGYYAIPPSQVVPFSPDDRKLEIPPAAVQFEHKGDKQRLQLEVLGVVRNEGEDKILSRLGGNFDVALTAQEYQSILNDKIFYRQDMMLYAGNYTVDLIVRDRSSGKVAAKREKIILPVDASEFWTTAAVLSRHAEPFRQTSGSGDVLSEGNVRIRPSPSHEFHTTDNLIIFFKIYNAAITRETGKTIVRVTLTLMKNGKPAIRPLDYQLTEPLSESAPHLTFAKYIKLTGLSPGEYSAVIETRDITQQKVVKQEAQFIIVP